ncbi:MAG: isochorismatase family protein [Verrucomicrobia bacterium]|nr:isochorismatase family protein [Verrucomicrobiota bacterium]
MRQRPWPRRPLLVSQLIIAGLFLAVSSTADALVLHPRHRERVAPDADQWRVVEHTVEVSGPRTAMIVCDMWDRHWCAGATARVAELAPRMNEVLHAARRQGMLIIHAPSDTMKFYADFPQRLRAREAPPAPAPADVRQWKPINPDREPPLPIDDSDGGCDDDPPCPQGNPWQRQIATLEILPEDVISDRGDEIHNVLTARGVDTVIVLGVHANMCVLGRPFAIRSLVALGKRVFLMRDLTDTTYNSRRRPYVRHFVGTDLVVEHIEKYWCPSITSADFLGGEPFRFAQDRRRRVVLLIGENEYRTWETLPDFAHRELVWRGFPCEVVAASTATDDFRFTNAAAVTRADLLVVSTRRRALPSELMAALRAHLAGGKSLLGIRTASHAFAVRGDTLDRLKDDPAVAQWPEFDPDVLGANYRGHHGAGPLTKIRVAPGAEGDPILASVNLKGFTSHSSLYRCGPLRPTARCLLLGAIDGQPEEPIAWTHRYGPREARIFYTSLGGPDDFANPAFRRLLLNAVLWCLNERIPPADAP